MTATLHALGSGRDAGSYYTHDPNREARPHRRDEYYVGNGGDHEGGAGGGVWWSSGQSLVQHNAPVDAEVFSEEPCFEHIVVLLRDQCAVGH